MTIQELKEYIFVNNKIEYVLENLNCHNIKYHDKHDYFSASFPDGDNPQGINIRNNKHLNYRSFSRGVDYDEGKDIVNLIEYITKKNFVESVKYLHNIFNLEYKWQKENKKEKKEKKEKENLNSIFTKHAWSKKKSGKVDVEDIHALDEEILNDYVPLPHIDFYRQGIMPWTTKKFGLAYSYKRKRIIIPHRYWLTGELVGINARTTMPNYEEFGINKYHLTSGYNKANNVYGYWENKEDIERANYCVIYESEKSTLKRDSLNDHTGLSLSGKFMSEEQARIILSLDVNEIVVALDKDVPIEEVWHVCEQFCMQRKVSYIQDSYGLLGEKDSPADAPNKIYNFLFKYRVPYDEEKRRQYKKSLEKKAV